jgi:low affinity Fe/Cu permease
MCVSWGGHGLRRLLCVGEAWMSKTKECGPSRNSGDHFAKLAGIISLWAGSVFAFATAALAIIIWGALGPWLNYSTGWQLLINTGTTITTFLMVFIIQNTQNRHSLAMQIKLDELIRAVRGARNTMIDLENLTELELAELQVRFSNLASKARNGEVPPTGAVTDTDELEQATVENT